MSGVIEIYTDGGCDPNPGPGGWAALIIRDGTKKEINGYDSQSTNNRMELTAAIRALSSLSAPARVKIYTDSSIYSGEWMNGCRDGCEKIGAAAAARWPTRTCGKSC